MVLGQGHSRDTVCFGESYKVVLGSLRNFLSVETQLDP